MDEQRMQAYVGLIEQLLGSAQGEETALLRANAELADAGLVVVMGQYADWLESQGKNAGWLRQFAAQLGQALGLRQTDTSGTEGAIHFLVETLQLVADSKGNSQKVYPVWAQQQERFNAELLAVMPQVMRQLFSGGAEQRIFVADSLVMFGNLIQQFPGSKDWLNLELCLTAHRCTLQIYNREVFPDDWAMTQNNLASAYLCRIRGEHSDNLEQAIVACELALQVRTRDKSLEKWARTQNNLAMAYHKRIQGERSRNLEHAITAYECALQVYTRDTSPEQWATAQDNLAKVYSERIQGERSRNLEHAITAYQCVLQVRTRNAFPEQWATTQSSSADAYFELANSYFHRIQGNRADNLERAITAYQYALQIHTRDAFPEQWAVAQNNLAIAYSARIKGERSDNLEQAIIAYKLALQVFTREVFPEKWAETQNNLASAYLYRIQGERCDNFEQAIMAFKLALQVKTHEAFPEDWAMVQNNLAFAYFSRVQGERSDNLEQAITACKLALQVYTRDALPEQWATAQNSLAIAYSARIKGERSDNLEQAITAYELALQVFTRDVFPKKWVGTQNNLASAYRNRIRGERSDNLEQAITTFQSILQVCTNNAFLEDWAIAQSNLANAYSDRIQGERSDNLEQAISAYQLALEVFTYEAFPNNCRHTARRLGNLHFDRACWEKATEAYEIALNASEVLYQSCIFLDGRAAELTEAGNLPRRAAYSLARIGNLQSSVEVLEQTRARGLSESLDRDRADFSKLQQLAPILCDQYQSFTTQLRNLENQQREQMTSRDHYNGDILDRLVRILTPLDTRDSRGITHGSETPPSEALRETITTLIQQRNTVIQTIRQIPGYETFLTLPKFEDVYRAVKVDQPLIYLVQAPTGILALVVTIEDTQSIWLDDLTGSTLSDLLINTWYEPYKKSQRDPKSWLDAIDSITHQLWELLMQPLMQHLKDYHFHQAILIPTGLLSLLPLHAAWTEDDSKPTGRRYAFDDIHITYAPNAKSLTAAQAIADLAQANSILAIDNPRQDLPNSEREVQAAIDSFLPHATILRHHHATTTAVKTALPQAAIVHLSCHGTANLNEPLNSGLVMSDGLLTLRDILALNLANSGGIRLAILSACETGLQGLKNADEAISLPTGLLQAGVAAVIASLWSVSDLSTMMLLARFYDLWRTEGLEISQALRQAQQWVRDTTNGEKIAYFKDFMPAQSAAKMPASTADYLYKSLILSRPNDRDFAHPFHWAAFSYVGV